MDIDEGFNRFTKIKRTKNRVDVSCVKGLWAVSAPTEEQALREARHYFSLYWADGEYMVVNCVAIDSLKNAIKIYGVKPHNQ